jgi:CDP-paratose 2-epimerase
MSRIVDTIRKDGTRGADGSARDHRSPPRTGSPELGVVSYFHFGDRERVERTIQNLERLGVERLRTAISWADWHRDDGRDWYDWVVPLITERFDVLPCFLYTPPSLGILPKSSSPPRDPVDYGDFTDHVLSKYEGRFAHIELWNEPNNYIEWDWTVDPEWSIFAEMIHVASERARAWGVRSVLGGMSPLDPNWLRLMYERGAMEHVDVIGIHGFPGTWESVWGGWDGHVERVHEVARGFGDDPQVWVTECGFSTWAHDEYRQISELVEVAQAPVSRAYWYSAEDLDPVRETLDGFHCDERAYHFGLFRRDGEPKLAARIWERGGMEALREMAAFGERRTRRPWKRSGALITGGAGFVGSNLADAVAAAGKPVMIIDSLARAGVERNLRWLKARHGDLVDVEISDLRDRFAIRRAINGCDQVFHLAAQVAVTTSLADPMLDMSVNVEGTLNLLEEARRLDDPPKVLFASTNKVYGGLEDVELVEQATRYEPADELLGIRGVDERRPLGFCSPYGCSKGAAEQYVLDYAHSYGLATAVLRMSCIYGPRQLGTEDQGWVAHFLIRALEGRPITIFGDGKQVRDILFVDDLIEAFLLAMGDERVMCGRAFNMGGGPANSVSLLEIVSAIEDLTGRDLGIVWGPWRVADQRYYASDTSAFRAATGWSPAVKVSDGLERLHRWLTDNRLDADAVTAPLSS